MSFGIPPSNKEEIDQQNEVQKTSFDTPQEDVLKEPQQSKFKEIITFFVPKKDFLVTPILLDLNILIFILMILSGVNFFQPDGESLLKWGANFKPSTLEGQYWRLITNCFLHIGIIHLLMNMYALVYIGLLLEPQIGSFKFSLAYIISGITASITSVCWHDITISAGASGAIFGLYGVFLALLTTSLIEKTARKALLTSIVLFVGYNLMYGMKGGIDNAAHLGGLLGGIIIGFSFYPMLKEPVKKTRNSLISAATFTGIAILSGIFLMNTSNPGGKYDEIMKEFAKAEERALSFYRLPKTTDDATYLAAVNGQGIPNWKLCSTLVDSIAKLEELPEELAIRTNYLKKYCKYRLKSYEFIAASIQNGTDVYHPMINQYNEKIDLIIRKMNGEVIADSLLDFDLPKVLRTGFPVKALYVLDGLPLEDISVLDPDKIVSMVFLMPGPSYQLYGERGSSGALIINTKNY